MSYLSKKKFEITSWIMEILHTPVKEEFLNLPVDKLNLSTRAAEGMGRAGIITISDFILLGPDKLSKVKNIGKMTIDEITNAINRLSSNIDENDETIQHNKSAYQLPLTTNEYIHTKNSSPVAIFDKQSLNTSIENLNLSTRAVNGLSGVGLQTVEDIISFGFRKLQGRKNVGKKTIKEIKDAILAINKQLQTVNRMSFVDAIKCILSGSTLKYMDIVKARYGYNDGKKKTLEAIGNGLGLTRERVRQIIARELELMKQHNKRKALETLIENIERLILSYKGIVSIDDMAKDSYFITGNLNQLRFLINLIPELYKERYRILDKYFLTSLNDDEIKCVQSNIRQAVLKSSFPVNEKIFMDDTILSIGAISKDYLSYHLLYKEHIETFKGEILSPGRLSIPKRVKMLMRDTNKPMHFSEIAKLYRDYFGDTKIKTKDLERAIHARISDSKDFIIVSHGTFMLRDKFKLPHNIEQVVKASKEILEGLKNISDTKFLINELKKRHVDTDNLNAYSLKSILLEYPGFISYRKFEIGLEELGSIYERKSVGDLIYEILQSVKSPMHLKSIWKEISKKRGFPKYTIDQKLGDDPRFIRVAPATYTVRKNIERYDEKYKVVISFAGDWIKLKKDAISAFFISEVLKKGKGIRDLSLGLVEHILATSPEFIKLPNGFYDLANKH